MRKIVAKWLLSKAEEDLATEKRELAQLSTRAAYLRSLVKEPDSCGKVGKESCWYDDAREKTRYVKEMREHVAFLTELVRELRKASR